MFKNTLITLMLMLISQHVFACTSDEYRQFDFWVGKWKVSNSTNNQISDSKISLINNGCGILEEYSTPSGYIGKSLNIYSAQSGKWHQTWVDNTGLLLLLDGEFKEGIMELTGETRTAKGQVLTNKISWQLLDDGRVNQKWQTSNDGGKTWQVAFDGYYAKQ